jgi:hypothetical protein
MTEELVFGSRQGKHIFFLFVFKASRVALCPNLPPIELETVAVSPGVKRLGVKLTIYTMVSN